MKIIFYLFVYFCRRKQIRWIIILYPLHFHTLHIRDRWKFKRLNIWHQAILIHKMQLKKLIKCRSPMSIQLISKSFYFHLYIDLHFLFIRLDESYWIKYRSFYQIFAVVIFISITMTVGVITVCLTSRKHTSMI